MPLRVEDVDLNDVDAFSEGFPSEAFRCLRKDDPVHWQPGSFGTSYWALTRHADIASVSKDSECFASRFGNLIFDSPLGDEGSAMMIQMDPPRHTQYRALVSRAFTPSTLRRIEPFVREQARIIVDRALECGDCDFVESVAQVLPMEVISNMLGLPESHRAPLFDLTRRIICFTDPEIVGSHSQVDSMEAMREYLEELTRGRVVDAADDLVGELLRAEVDGERLTPDNLVLFFMMLAIAGSETTKAAIASGAVAFASHPDAWAALSSDSELMASAVEEVLRWDSPFHYFRRTATRDVEVAGVKIRKGERVVMWYGSGNRDEAVFPDPERFDIRRTPNDHLSFGIGRHFCLGANLSRLELRALFGELVARGAEIELTGRPVWVRSNFVNSLKRLPVSLRVRRRPSGGAR